MRKNLLVHLFLLKLELVDIPVFSHLPRVGFSQEWCKRLFWGSSFNQLLWLLSVGSERGGKVIRIFFDFSLQLALLEHVYFKLTQLNDLLGSFMDRQHGLTPITFLLLTQDLLRFQVWFHLWLALLEKFLAFLYRFQLTQFVALRLPVKSFKHLMVIASSFDANLLWTAFLHLFARSWYIH